jgi:uncharacterized protein YlxW (UPF0749 family)
VQELRDAGAEALQINGVRVVASTSFADLKAGVVIDGATVASPVVVKAIGDPATLASSLAIPGGVTETARSQKVTVRVVKSATVEVDALRAPKTPRYASPTP